MKMKFNWDDEAPLNNMLELPSMTIVVRSAFHENMKYYPKFLFNECLQKSWIIWRCYILIEVIFLKELMLIKDQKSASKECVYLSILLFLK